MRLLAPLIALMMLTACGPALITQIPTDEATSTEPPNTQPILTRVPIAVEPETVQTSELGATPTAMSSPTPLIPSGEIDFEFVSTRWGASHTLAVQGSTVYLGMGPRMAIIDAGNPATPRLVSQSDLLPGIVRALVVDGTSIYVAAGNALVTLDVSDPSVQVSVSEQRLPFVPLALLLRDDTLYAAGAVLKDTGLFLYSTDQDGMLAGFNVSQAGHPELLGTLATNDPISGLAIKDHVLYAGPHLIDVSDPAVLASGDTHYMPSLSSGPPSLSVFAVFGDTLLSGQNNGITALDISDPMHPEKLFTATWMDDPPETITFIGDVIALAAQGRHAYVMTIYDSGESFGAFDLGYTVEGSAGYAASVRMAVVGNYLYVAKNGLQIFRAQNPLKTPIGVFESIGVTDVEIDARAAYVLGGSSSILGVPEVGPVRSKVVSLNLADLSTLGTYEPAHTGALMNIAAVKDRLYIDEAGVSGVAWDTGLHVIDTHNPGAMSLLDTYGREDGLPVTNAYGFTGDPMLSDHWLVKSSDDQRVGFAALDLNTGVVTKVLLEDHIFNIYAATDALIFGTMLGPDQVSDVGIIETGSWKMLSRVSAGDYINDIAAGDDFALVTTFQGVTMISTADARSARVVDQIKLPDGAYEVAVVGNHAYVTSFGDGAGGYLYAFIIGVDSMELAAMFDLPVGQVHIEANDNQIIIGNHEVGVYLLEIE